MTASQQVDILHYFKDGKHKILIATSVAEEGLDIQKCNLVLRYVHVTNDVARVQSRGRARADNAKFKIIGDSNIQDRDLVNRLREELAAVAMNQIHNMSVERFQHYISECQRAAKIERKINMQEKRAKEAQKQALKRRGDEFELRCFKCDSFAAFSSDIRVISGSHHVVIDEEFDQKRVQVRPHPKPVCYDGFNKKWKIFCKKCGYDWGIKALYKSAGFCVIKIESFVIINRHSKRECVKKWKNAPFAVGEISVEDLEKRIQTEQDE